ncbi:hypothetical protein TNCV_4762931 [Trichonephila clavipes]|nr:hypothetical protein TNCV_4762931 [Trichonephila clavipes]
MPSRWISTSSSASKRKWTCCCSAVWGKIASETGTESSHVLLDASKPDGHESFRATIDDTPINSEMELVVRISIAADTVSCGHTSQR